MRDTRTQHDGSDQYEPGKDQGKRMSKGKEKKRELEPLITKRK
jgi:hypothetical protein